MQFLAIRTDVQPTAEVWRNFVHKVNIPCFTCKEITYQLWAPLEHEDAMVETQTDWLKKQLPSVCPVHPDWFRTEDLG